MIDATESQRDEIRSAAEDAAIELERLLNALSEVDGESLVSFGYELPEALNQLAEDAENV